MNGKTRIDKLKGINLGITNATDAHITEMYNIFTEDIKYNIKDEPNRQQMTLYMMQHMCLASDELVTCIHNYVDKNALITENGVYYINGEFLDLMKSLHKHFVNKPKAVKNAVRKTIRNTKNNIDNVDDVDNINGATNADNVDNIDIIDNANNVNNVDDTNNVNDARYQMVLKFANGILSNLNVSKIKYLTDFKNIDRDDIVTEKNTQLLEGMADEMFELFDKKTCRYYPKNTKSWVLNVLRGITRNIGYKLVNSNVESFKGKYRGIAMRYQIIK